MRFMPCLLLCLLAIPGFAQTYTLHLYSPWAGTAQGDQTHCVNGGFGGGLYSCSANAQMTSEGGGWYTYTFTGPLTDWWDMTLKSCPVATDQNCNGGVSWGVKPKIVDYFKQANQVWVYPEASSYRISLVSPTAKIVIYKSPWGNKSFPRLVVGADTLLMRPYSTCGWYWAGLEGAQRTLPSVFFLKPYTALTVPLAGTVDLSPVLDLQDTAYVDGTTATAIPLSAIGSAGTCFDSSRVVHILSPWESDIDRGALPVYLHAGNLLGNQTAMVADGLPFWWRHSFSQANTLTQDWGNSTLDVYSFFPNPENGRKTYADHIRLTTLFPPNEFEVWLVPVGNSFRILRAQPRAHYINMLSPWNTTVPKGILGGDTIPMKRITGFCGWYSLVAWEEPLTWSLHFKQALGHEIYTQAGLEAGSNIVLDSILDASDTVWLMPSPYPTGSPSVSRRFPGILGDCPTRSLAVMIFDWADADPDFGNTYSGSGNICPGLVRGMVQPVLGPNGLPVKSPTIPATCTASENITGWFLPQVLTGGYTNATCYDLPLELDPEGFWLADIAENQARNIDGFFPVDEFRWLDPAQTIPNPKREIENGHNYLYSMHINAEFTYIPGQYFEFRGDDDVWVFIDDRLVVDIGGVHGPEEGAVNLDTMGLTPDSVYSFHIFYAERNCCGANFKMRTSIDLRTDRTYYPIQVDAPQGQIKYQIWQILRQQSLSCDFSSVGAVDTVRAPSRFEMTGPQFTTGPAQLVVGVNFGGIFIDEDYAGFTIDTSAIVRSRLLAPGTYTIRFIHALDASMNSQVTFVVPTYPLPSILFTDSLWNPINPDTVILGEWAFVPYPVYIEARYVGIRCLECQEELVFNTTDSLIFMNSQKQPITRVRLDSGRVMIWVMGQKSVVEGVFTVSSPAVQNTLTWQHINLREPPVPFLRYSTMHDRNGDGVADSLTLAFSRSLQGDDAPDSLVWQWGNSLPQKVNAVQIAQSLVHDSLVVLVGDSLVPELFTGLSDGSIYRGNSITYFTYIATDGVDAGTEVPFEINGTIDDRIGAVVLGAEIAIGKTGIDTLIVQTSESLIRDDDNSTDSLIELTMWRTGVNQGAQSRAVVSTGRSDNTRWYFLFRNTLEFVPTVGDSVRLHPGPITDLSEVTAHALNPKVRIIGRQRSRMETVGLVEIRTQDMPGPNSPVVREVLVPSSMNIKEVVAEQGVPGHLIRYDLSNLVELYEDEADPSEIFLEYDAFYYTNLGQFVNKTKSKIACTDSLFLGDCTRNPGNIFIGWNLRSQDGRSVGSGPYLAKMQYRIKVKKRILEDVQDLQMWGVRRKK